MDAWNNFDWRFRVHVPKPKKDTTIQDFLDIFDGKTSIWHEMAKLSPTKITNLLVSHNHS